MKRFIPSLTLLAACMLGALASPALSQASSTSKSLPDTNVASGNARIFWSTTLTREILEYRSQLDRMQQDMTTWEGKPGFTPQLREERMVELRGVQSRLDLAMKLAPEAVTIEFNGGTLQSLISSIEESNPKVSFNIIVGGSLDLLVLDLPKFSLRNADLKTVFGVLQSLLGPRGYNLTLTGNSDSPNAIFGVLQHGDSSSGAKAGPAQELEALQLADYVFEKQTVEVIVDAIRAAWKLQTQQDASLLRIQYHPGTSILLVSGPSPAKDVAQRVVEGLRKKPLAR